MVWDDGYGISVPIDLQTTKGSISEACRGMAVDKSGNGLHIHEVMGWDYPNLVATFETASHQARTEHRPVLVHVKECTQPQGHSTSGSHERYKTKERLEWEADYDCIKKMAEWILANGFAEEATLDKMHSDAKAYVKQGAKNAWNNYQNSLTEIKKELVHLFKAVPDSHVKQEGLADLQSPLPMAQGEILAVSYTHLTLPTICSV